MNVVMIGSGNVAWHLASALENIGHKVAAVYSRDKSHAKALPHRLYEVAPVDSLDFGELHQHYSSTVSDQAIEEVAKELILPNEAIGLHTSGSTLARWIFPMRH